MGGRLLRGPAVEIQERFISAKEEVCEQNERALSRIFVREAQSKMDDVEKATADLAKQSETSREELDKLQELVRQTQTYLQARRQEMAGFRHPVTMERIKEFARIITQVDEASAQVSQRTKDQVRFK